MKRTTVIVTVVIAALFIMSWVFKAGQGSANGLPPLWNGDVIVWAHGYVEPGVALVMESEKGAS